MSVRDVNSNSISWKWNMSDLERVDKNGLKVFTCFSCAGGSSFGYKLAGYDVLGNVEIDPEINKIYIANHKPEYNFCMDIREFIKQQDIPAELFDIDILDGSPPCTSFSMAGDREASWGKEKKFAEGQALQTLDDLFFYFLDVAKLLNPKVIVAENVQGIIKGNARGYCNLIIARFAELGYDVQMFLLNSAVMGVPQSRPRVFFVARKHELNLPDIKLKFNEPPIPFGKVRSEKGVELSNNLKHKKLLAYRKRNDKSMKDIYLRVFGKESNYNNTITADNTVAFTLTSGGRSYRGCDGTKFSRQDYISVSSFPQDFICPENKVRFCCGMSVPPLMTHRIAEQIKLQWFDELANT